jgi:glycosyltransferase involved in cell wall biosynthesis
MRPYVAGTAPDANDGVAGGGAPGPAAPKPTRVAVARGGGGKTKTTTTTTTTTLTREYPNDAFLRRLSRLWGHLLVLPSLEEVRSYRRRRPRPPDDGDDVGVPAAAEVGNDETIRVLRDDDDDDEDDDPPYYRISLIVPAYHERGAHLRAKLSRALEMARCPGGVEVVIVDAGGCDDLEVLLAPPAGGVGGGGGDDDDGDRRSWGRLSVFVHATGGGRGPCLNYGASVASGRILTFCHSDTTLPRHWDDGIASVLDHDGIASDDDLIASNATRANSCAFSFGIDTSPEGLSMPFVEDGRPSYAPADHRPPYCPPGIRAVEATANLRTHLYSLPYGDQVLSLHACVFDFLGGFPDQCLMEDYELVSLLRRRAALFAVPRTPGGNPAREGLAIIPGDPALCSPRRWQKFGVLYVTYMNSRFVNLYAGTRRMGPDELFRLYYGKDPPTRVAVDSPWEVELANRLEATSALKA